MGSIGETPRSTFDRNDIADDISFFKTIFRLTDATREACIPAMVLEREDEYGLIKVQPLVNMMKQMSKGLVGFKREPIWVRPFKTLHGGFHISVPIFKGDTGYIIACDRDATEAQKKNSSILHEDQREDDKNPKNEGSKNPSAYDYQKYNYGYFVPCSWVMNDSEELKERFNRDEGILKDKFVLSNVYDDNDERFAQMTMDRSGVIEAKTHSCVVSVEEGIITINAETRQDNPVDGEEPKKTRIVINKDGTLEIECENVKLTAKESKVVADLIQLNGATKVNGDLSVSGNIAVTEDVNVRGVSFSTHVHDSAEVGQATSTPYNLAPVPEVAPESV